jgi:hypothetical protein
MKYAICRGSVLPNRLGLNQCLLIGENPLPRSQICYPMRFHHQLKTSCTRKGEVHDTEPPTPDQISKAMLLTSNHIVRA